ncbi:MAG: hypothetical protein LBE48_03425, partial [Methanomassiliicoccaceae archaeon]|nr:hypothetical protein [Methanomassiliicoccaceae archaeon]
SDFYRAGKVLYAVGDNKGFVAERNIRRTFSVILTSVTLWCKTFFIFGKLKKRYRESLKKYSSDENWRRIFSYTEDGSERK